MREEEITVTYWLVALCKLLGITNHRITVNNKLQWIEIRIERIRIALPITTDYKTIKRIIKKELTNHTFHKSLTPNQYHWKRNTNLILKSSKSDMIVKQEPLLDLYY